MSEQNMTRSEAAFQLSTDTAKLVVQLGGLVEKLSASVQDLGERLNKYMAQEVPGTVPGEVAGPSDSAVKSGW